MYTLLSFGLLACSPVPPENQPSDLTAESETSEKFTGEVDAVSKYSDTSIESAMDWYNEAERFEEAYEYTFTELPLAGRLSKIPWSGDYWAKNKGGIAYRWQTEEKHDYTKLSKEEVQYSSTEEIALLSPTEKYDLYVGNYDYSLTHRVLAESGRNEPGWSGFCHGWSPASNRFEEPSPITVYNPDGVEIPFGSSDIKALLTYFEAEVVRSSFVGHDWSATTYTIGSLCRSGEIMDPGCYDTNPAAFHIVLANRIGMMDEGFNMDVDKGYEKWNQPVHSYRSTILTTRPPTSFSDEDTVVEYIMETEVHWTVEIHPMWEPILHTEHQKSQSKTYTYSVEVDKDGTVIGGQWLTEASNGQYVNIEQVYNYFSTLDENGDGQPDMGEDEVNLNTWYYFEMPDYLWYQDELSLNYAFEPLGGMYDIVGTTASSREALFGYFGQLQDLVKE